ncbi:MAG: hypothetical protein ACI4NG_00455 [Candidatus Gallimonas sp.]
MYIASLFSDCAAWGSYADPYRAGKLIVGSFGKCGEFRRRGCVLSLLSRSVDRAALRLA